MMRWVSLISFFWCGAISAQSEPLEPLSTDPLSSSYMLKLTGGLLAVVLIIFLTAWILKRLNLTHRSQGGLLRIIAGLQLGTRDRIVLLQVGKEQILLGLSPGHIEKLHTLEEPLDIDDTQPHATPFARKINELMQKDATK